MALKLKNQGLSVSPLDPTGMPDLVAWYKADSLALSNGATVTNWPDDSPNNNDLDNYESAPIYNSSDALLNGMPSVTYDGNDSNYRSNPTGLPVGSSACTTYVVGYWSGASSTADMFTWGSNAYTGARMGAGYYGGMIFENGGIGTLARSVSANQSFIFSYPYVTGANVTEAVSYLDGVSAAGSNMGQSGVPNISNPVAEITIGRPATAATERWTGAVAEVLVFNTTHNEVTRGRIERYLANKYGIPITPVKIVGSFISKGSGSGFKVKSVSQPTPEAPITWSNYLLSWYRSDNVTLDGSYVTVINDKSGNGRHLGQSNGNTYYPTIETNTGGTFGNYDTWRFSGSPQYMTGTIWNLDDASDVGYTVFHVFASRTTGASKGVWDMSPNQLTNTYGLAAWGPDGNPPIGIVRSGVTPTLSFTRPTDNVPLVFTVNWRTGSSGTNCEAWINGSSVSGPTTLVGAGTSNPSHFRIGSLWQDVWHFESSQAELLIFSGTLPEAGRAAIEAYLMNRYNIA